MNDPDGLVQSWADGATVRDIREARRPARTPEDARDLTDTGNAAHLVQLHGPWLRYIPQWGKWLVCGDDGFYTLDHRDVHVRELAKGVGEALKLEAVGTKDADEAKRLFAFAFKSLNAHAITAMVDLARGIDGIPLDHEELDRDGWLLGVQNGVVDLRDGTFRDATPADLLTLRCDATWDEDARAPRFEQALEEWFPNAEVRAYVQRVAGAALVGGQRDHVFIIHYGAGGNGKGTFTRALQRVLGPYAVEIHLSLLVETRFKEHDTVRADLFRTRLAVAVETERRVRLAEASVKNLTGGDRIRARRMREDPWSFDPTHSLWLQTNHLPEISGRDTGIWRRIRVVKWVNTFDKATADPGLDERLAAEAPGILRWLVEGCMEWQEHGLSEPEAVIRETLAYRRAEDTFARFAADTELVFRPDLEIPAGQLQTMLDEWSGVEGRKRPDGIKDWLEENGAGRKQKRVRDADGEEKRRWFWVGIGLDDGNHESEQTNAL
jgi:putative DNA primase/helicase